MEGLFLGLATGPSCLMGCTPSLIPYLLKEKKGSSVFLFLSGRLLSYIGLAWAAWWCGAIFSPHQQLFLAISYMGLSLLLLFWPKTGHLCPRRIFGCCQPFLLGIFTALSFCPSLLLAFAAATKQNSICGALLFFASFFIGSSIYFLPLALIGRLKKFSFLQHLGQVSSYLVGGIYFLTGSFLLLRILL